MLSRVPSAFSPGDRVEPDDILEPATVSRVKGPNIYVRFDASPLHEDGPYVDSQLRVLSSQLSIADMRG